MMAVVEPRRQAIKPENVTTVGGRHLPAPLQMALANLSPAYFALVMGTGILDVACQLQKIPLLPQLLLPINLIAYAALWILTVLRLLYFRKNFLDDFSSHQRGPGFFTAVAATSVLGIEIVLQWQMAELAYALWWFAFALWLILTYAIFTALTVRENKPAFENSINGGWLTAVVATQSLVVLGCTLTRAIGSSEAAMLVLVSFWFAGGMLYIWMISLIFYRYTFFRFNPQDLTPPYWINMGAMAISTLAGTLLIGVVSHSPLLTSLQPFIKGLTLLFWATATWWIPMLIILGAWRYVFRKVPLTYDPLYWGAVFPLAMYTTATYRVAEVFELSFLFFIPRLFIGLALTTWLLTFLGLFVTIAVGFKTSRYATQPRTHLAKHLQGDMS